MRDAIPILCAALLLGVAAEPLSADTFEVPGDGTLAEVVALAEATDVDNIIKITESPVILNATVTIDHDIGPGTLIIRPEGMDRAVIARTVGPFPLTALVIDQAIHGVTLQDLDIVLNWSHFTDDLVKVQFSTDVTIERCRIGSVWPSELPAPGTSVLSISYPTEVVVRNCIIFSYFKGNFDYGIRADSFNDPGNSLFLYNNDVADYRVRGIWVDGGAPGALALLRNNVVMNHPDWAAGAEPTCYWTTVVAATMTVETSHNVAYFDGAAKHEDGGGVSILGIGSDDLQLARADIDPSFETYTWVRDPDPNWWNPNTDYFRLDVGPLHDEDSDWGQNVDDGSPYVSDKAVHDDIEGDERPGQPHSHTDRGADQAPPSLHIIAMPGLSPWGLMLLCLMVMGAGTGWLVQRRGARA